MTNLKQLNKKYPNIDLSIAYAFISEKEPINSGNGAGVVLDFETQLSSDQMQEIARIFGFSESAFVSKVSSNTYRVSFFTPTTQVEMCGHATVATWGCLLQKGLITPGKYMQQIGLDDDYKELSIEVDGEGLISTELALPSFKNRIPLEIINRELTLSIGNSTLKPQIVNTGFDELLIPVDSISKFEEIHYENIPENLIISFQRAHGVEGIEIFIQAPKNDIDKADFYVKNTDPINGIYPYDNATGTTNGALISYLFKNRIVSKEQFESGILVKQFGEDNRVSLLRINGLANKHRNIVGLRVSGRVNCV